MKYTRVVSRLFQLLLESDEGCSDSAFRAALDRMCHGTHVGLVQMC
jgi:hypothetical protein